VIGDGAEWIWNLAHRYFPGAIQIVDLYHARQRLWELDEGKIENLVCALRSIETGRVEIAEEIRTKSAYFQTHDERMRRPEFRRQHLFAGSGDHPVSAQR
jgi:hypothetical protein